MGVPLLVMGQPVDLIAPDLHQLGGAVDIPGLQAGTGEIGLPKLRTQGLGLG